MKKDPSVNKEKSYWGTGRPWTIFYLVLLVLQFVLVATGLLSPRVGVFIILPGLIISRSVLFRWFDR